MGPCAPVLDTCGDCLGACARLFDHGHDRYAESSPEGSMGLPEGAAYGLRDHCIDGDCRPVYAHRDGACHGICQPVYDGWVECEARADRCETLSQPAR